MRAHNFPHNFFRNEAGKVIGCLCINRNIHRWKMAHDVLEDYIESHPLGKGNVKNDPETLVQDVEELLMGTINEEISLERKPVEFMSKAGKIRVIQTLDNRRIFLNRGVIQTVERALNVSRHTIFKTLEGGRQLDTRGNV
jgi:predicted transcriptional regulator YheO